MKTTPHQAIPYPEPGDSTRTWEYWQSMAERLDALLTNGFAMPLGNIAIGDPNVDGQYAFSVSKLDGANHLTGYLNIMTGGALVLRLTQNGVEVNRLRLQPDGSIVQAVSSAPARPVPYATFTTSARPYAGHSIRVDFPAGRFTAPPLVFCQIYNELTYQASTLTIDATGCTITSNAPAASYVSVFAVQMLAGSAFG